MSGDLVLLRRSAPDLARLDPLSKEVSEWIDTAYGAVRVVDEAEGVIFRMHQRYLLDPAEKVIAGAEIVETIDRAVRTSEIMHRTGMMRQRTAQR